MKINNKLYILKLTGNGVNFGLISKNLFLLTIKFLEMIWKKNTHLELNFTLLNKKNYSRKNVVKQRMTSILWATTLRNINHPYGASLAPSN